MRVLPTLLALAALCQGATPAFPGAEGFGASAAGGRGGDVYKVTNLNDSGPGSLREGITSAAGPRTIVFDVAGTIELKSTLTISKPFLTLAGQTAPGGGITLAGWGTAISNTHDVIVRYLRFRPGDTNCPRMQGDSLTVDRSTDVILDHVSASWSVDETLSVTDSDRVTVQWSMIAESMNQSCHEEGAHGYGSLLRYGAGGITFHHNLYAHHRNRTPRLGDNLGLDFVNNVIYDYAANGDGGYSGEASEGKPRLNYIGNYIVAGPSTPASRRTRAFYGGSANTLIWQAGNRIDGNLNKLRDGADIGWAMIQGAFTQQTQRFDFPQVATDDAAEAYERVLAGAGASFVRDAVDARIVEEVRQEGGKIVNSQKDVGGWPTLATAPAAADSDGDGIPDAWETAHKLNPRDPADGPANLEQYLNSILAPEAEPGTVVLNDEFADGNSQNQDLAHNSVWLFNGRTNNIRTDRVGSVTIDATPAGTGSEAVWAFFTEPGQPVVLGVGDKLTVAVTFSLAGFKANGQDIRWGVFDSLGTRNRSNLSGGHNDATFVNDPAYGLQFYASGSGSPFVLGRRTVLSNANVFNNFADFAPISGSGATARQPLADDTRYTLTYSIERIGPTTTRLSTDVSGGKLEGLSYSGVESNSSPVTSFDSFAFRVAGTNFAEKLTFYRLAVRYVPAPPSITAQPQPSALTVQVGSDVTLAAGGGGSAISYQWLKDGRAIAGNPSALTPTLTLTAVTLADAGRYTLQVINSGGVAVSNAVVLQVSISPVPPAPKVTRQPASATAVLGETAVLSVEASGDALVYQWFKNGTILPGATAAFLRVAAATMGDAASYHVVVSNGSGSVASSQAVLRIVSPMYATSISPWNGYAGLPPDVPLAIEFSQTPVVGKSGRIRIVNSAGTVVDTIDMAANPQTRTIGGVPYVYYPVIVSGRTAHIYPHAPLPYGDAYTVRVESGVVTDEAGAPFAGFSESDAWTFRVRAAGPPAGATSLLVSADNFGDFRTVQAAIDFVPAGNTTPVTITVRPGVYLEINYVPSNKPFITVRGTDRERTVIQYANNANLNAGNPRAMFGVDAPDFTLENITLWNTTPRGGSQAEAFRSNNSRILLNRVILKSYQDTVLLQGSVLVTDSYIEGDVDFLWGNGVVFVQNSEIRAVTSGGYYTQIRNAQGQKGYVFLNCRLTAPEGVTGVYLSRIDPTVFPYSQVVWINTAMGVHITPVGWLLNNATTAQNVQFWEYRSTDLAGIPLNVSQRAAFSRQMTDLEAAQWSEPGFVLGWTPYTVNAAVTSVTRGATFRVNWTAAPGHTTRDWVGLFEMGAADTSPLSRQYLEAGTAGRVTVTAPNRSGDYELRVFLNDGYSRVAISDRVEVK